MAKFLEKKQKPFYLSVFTTCAGARAGFCGAAKGVATRVDWY
jgi:hypothetical protein